VGGNGGEGRPVVEFVHGILEVLDCGLSFVFGAFAPVQVDARRKSGRNSSEQKRSPPADAVAPRSINSGRHGKTGVIFPGGFRKRRGRLRGKIAQRRIGDGLPRLLRCMRCAITEWGCRHMDSV